MPITAGAKVPDFSLTIGGMDFSSHQSRGMVMRIEVDQPADGMAQFEVTLDDSQGILSQSGCIKEGHSAQISMGFDGNLKKMMDGIVTSVKTKRAQGNVAKLIVKGSDKLYNLSRGRKRNSWEEMKDCDLVADICAKNGLDCDAEDCGLINAYIVQNNLTDFNFIMERARRIGYTVHIDPEDGDTVIFKKPNRHDGSVVLTWDGTKADGKTAILQSLAFDTKPQPAVHRVVVRSYDPATAEPIVGEAEFSGGAGMSHHIQVSDTPVNSAEEAELYAQAVLDQRLVEERSIGRGRCVGCNEIRPGKKITIEDAGPQYNGDYYVTQCVQTLIIGNGARTGYWTKFQAYQIP